MAVDTQRPIHSRTMTKSIEGKITARRTFTQITKNAKETKLEKIDHIAYAKTDTNLNENWMSRRKENNKQQELFIVYSQTNRT